MNRSDLPEQPVAPDWDEILSTLTQVYSRLAPLTAHLDEVHAERLHCRSGCYSCCVDDITVFEVEAENIRRNHAELLSSGTPHASGACAFLDEQGACRIYDHRPYVCRTQGYPLRWLDEDEDGQVVEMRDICPLNDGNEPVEAIAAEDCWTLGPFEDFLRDLQSTADGGKMTRTLLRDLFGQ